MIHRAEWDARTQEYELRHESGERWYWDGQYWKDQDAFPVIYSPYTMRIRLKNGPHDGTILRIDEYP